MRKSPQPVHSLSTVKISYTPPRGTHGNWSQAKLYRISERQWAPETWHEGPSVSGKALLPVNCCPSYG